jgi:hypothetical protein
LSFDVRSRSRSLTLAAAVLTACGSDALEPTELGTLRTPLVGGSAVAPGAFPDVVLLDPGCTGVLIADDTVLYAAHCGTNIARGWLGDALEVELDPINQTVSVRGGARREVVIDECVAHPDAVIGQPLDIAFCRLTAPVPMTATPTLALAPCEHEQLRPGLMTTMVGLGVEPRSGRLGEKQLARTPLLEAGDVLVAGDTTQGSCAGDSGGPLFVRTEELNAEWPREWRLAGILSSGNASELCGVGRYVDVARVAAWIEAESQRDLTPCTSADGAWAPNARCRGAALDADGVPAEPLPYSAACGAAFSEDPADVTPPHIDGVAFTRLVPERGEPTLDVVPSAADDGWGVASVTLELLAANGAVIHDQRNENAPFTFEGVPLPVAAERLRVTALDHAGLSSTLERSLDEPVDAGCTLGARPPREARSALAAMLIALLAGFAQRRASAGRGCS